MNLKFQALGKNSEILNIRAVVVLKVEVNVRRHDISESHLWSHLNGSPYCNGFLCKIVHILLGADIFAFVLMAGKRVGQAGIPVAINSSGMGDSREYTFSLGQFFSPIVSRDL